MPVLLDGLQHQRSTQSDAAVAFPVWALYCKEQYCLPCFTWMLACTTQLLKQRVSHLEGAAQQVDMMRQENGVLRQKLMEMEAAVSLLLCVLPVSWTECISLHAYRVDDVFEPTMPCHWACTAPDGQTVWDMSMLLAHSELCMHSGRAWCAQSICAKERPILSMCLLQCMPSKHNLATAHIASVACAGARQSQCAAARHQGHSHGSRSTHH